MTDLLSTLGKYIEKEYPEIENDITRLINLVVRRLDPGKDLEWIQQVVRGYFILYTLPIFDKAKYWAIREGADTGHMDLLLEAHLWLNVHLRLTDNIIDRDESPDILAAHLRLALRALEESKCAIRVAGYEWDDKATELYELYLHYDEMVRNTNNIDPDMLWKRVSPMMLVPELYLSNALTDTDRSHYRAFLNFMLLSHDLDDLFDDVRASRLTFPTAILRDNTGFYRELAEDVFSATEGQLQRFAHTLFQSLDLEAAPLWTKVVQVCVRTFQSYGPIGSSIGGEDTRR